MNLADILKWSASISSMVAVFPVTLDLGRHVKGWRFLPFIGSSICCIGGAPMTGDAPPWAGRLVPFRIDPFGGDRHLTRKRKPRDSD
ncbi:hypothetical protein [Sphingomonas pituitosa]|uniref:hypothetical protein n=1 Tax=Sphingomonas pituitosa TaxID=99597 RepID=UPI0008310E7A|nr:hypothetical protein [Sphingomonas pituitosa]